MPHDDPPREAPPEVRSSHGGHGTAAFTAMHGHVRRMDHVAMATWQIEPLLPLYRDLLGGTFVLGGDDARRGLRTLQLDIAGQAKVELIMPTTEASTLRPFLEHHGPGVHHVTFLVHDLVAAMSELDKAGFETTGADLTNPRWRETYIRPPSAGGVLIQLADTTEDWSTPLFGTDIDDVLGGAVEWIDYAPVRVDGSDIDPWQRSGPDLDLG